MALLGKENLFASKWLRVNRGLNEKGDTGIVQMVLVSPTTREVKAVNLNDQRWEEAAQDLETAARQIRASYSV